MDDIDIAMPRKDYERFMQSFDSEKYGVYFSHTQGTSSTQIRQLIIDDSRKNK